MTNANATRYSVAPVDKPEATIHGYTAEQAAELAKIDATDVAWAVEEHGRCDTAEFVITETPSETPQDASDVMMDPANYANFMISFSGSKERAYREFSEAVDTDPSFRFAPRSWVNAVLAALS